jgi:hypothetical protein
MITGKIRQQINSELIDADRNSFKSIYKKLYDVSKQSAQNEQYPEKQGEIFEKIIGYKVDSIIKDLEEALYAEAFLFGEKRDERPLTLSKSVNSFFIWNELVSYISNFIKVGTLTNKDLNIIREKLSGIPQIILSILTALDYQISKNESSTQTNLYLNELKNKYLTLEEYVKTLTFNKINFTDSFIKLFDRKGLKEKTERNIYDRQAKESILKEAEERRAMFGEDVDQPRHEDWEHKYKLKPPIGRRGYNPSPPSKPDGKKKRSPSPPGIPPSRPDGKKISRRGAKKEIEESKEPVEELETKEEEEIKPAPKKGRQPKAEPKKGRRPKKATKKEEAEQKEVEQKEADEWWDDEAFKDALTGEGKKLKGGLKLKRADYKYFTKAELDKLKKDFIELEHIKHKNKKQYERGKIELENFIFKKIGGEQLYLSPKFKRLISKIPVDFKKIHMDNINELFKKSQRAGDIERSYKLLEVFNLLKK